MSHADTLDQALRLLARARRWLAIEAARQAVADARQRRTERTSSMTEQAPDPLEGQWADVHLIEDAVLAEVEHAEWSSTGGYAKGCTLCRDKSFRERCDAGHHDCAREMARVEGAEGVRAALVCGGLRATLSRVVADPRLGEWKKHLDWWAAR